MTLPQPRAGILGITPYLGGEGRGDLKDPVRLASNENALGSSEKAMAAYLAAADDLHRYPDGAATALRQALGRKYGIDPAQIVCGAGSEQLITLLVQAYAGPGDEVVYSQYGFALYPIAAQAAGATPVAAPEKNLRADIDALLAAVTPRTRVMLIANPNNPTGSYLTRADMKTLREKLREDVLLVIDSAYAEFALAEDYEDGQGMVNAYNNVVMLRTFSKIYGLAAVRLGWGYFPVAVADVMNRVRVAFNVGVAAQAAGIAALDDDDFLNRTLEMNRAGMAQMTAGLAALGVTPYPSVGNFLLVPFGPRAEDIRQALKTRGIFVRQMGAYGLPETLRITIGRAQDNARVLDALKEIL